MAGSGEGARRQEGAELGELGGGLFVAATRRELVGAFLAIAKGEPLPGWEGKPVFVGRSALERWREGERQKARGAAPCGPSGEAGAGRGC